MQLIVTERLMQANNNFPLPAVLCTCMLIETAMEQWFINLEPVCGSGQAFLPSVEGQAAQDADDVPDLLLVYWAHSV
jgi:hypothetical protein